VVRLQGEKCGLFRKISAGPWVPTGREVMQAYIKQISCHIVKLLTMKGLFVDASGFDLGNAGYATLLRETPQYVHHTALSLFNTQLDSIYATLRRRINLPRP
jgi:hypothetical protein